MNLLYREVIVEGPGCLRNPARLLPTTPQKCMYNRRREDLSGHTVWLTSQ